MQRILYNLQELRKKADGMRLVMSVFIANSEPEPVQSVRGGVIRGTPAHIITKQEGIWTTGATAERNWTEARIAAKWNQTEARIAADWNQTETRIAAD